MRDQVAFRLALRERLRVVGCTQQQLARAIGLHPHVLSHKLHERDAAALTTPEVVSIVVTMAGWGGVGSKADALALLDLMALPPEAIPAESWATKPLAPLPEGPSQRPAGGPPGGRAPRGRSGPARRRGGFAAVSSARENSVGSVSFAGALCGARGERAPARDQPPGALLSAGRAPRRLWRPCSATKGRGC